MKFTGATTGGNSQLFDNGTNVGLGTTSPTARFHVVTATSVGMRVENSNASNDAISGSNTAAEGSGSGTGVAGTTAQWGARAAGVRGENSHANGTGVIGVGNGRGSTVLTAGSGGAFVGLTTGAFARSTTDSEGQAIYTEQFTDPVRVGFWNGSTFYKINGVGTVSTNVVDATDPRGERRITLHAPEAPEILFQDFGEGQLVDGRAYVELDPRFAGAVKIDKKHPLRVFIQLEDDENIVGVVVKNKSERGFEVVERMGGRSNARFQWHVIANRADEVLPSGRISRYADVRFEELPPPEPTLDEGDGKPTTSPQSLAAARGPAPHDDISPENLADVGDGAQAIAPATASCSSGSSGLGGGLALLGLMLARPRRRSRSTVK